MKTFENVDMKWLSSSVLVSLTMMACTPVHQRMEMNKDLTDINYNLGIASKWKKS